jgi:hypothetical protein
VTAEPKYAPDRFERAIAAIHELIGERGVGQHALFGEVNEGAPFPDGTEAMSGHVLDVEGRVFFFWTDWDAELQRPTFTIWRDVVPEGRLIADGEYLQARRAVGLDRPTRSLSMRGPSTG